MIYIDTSVLVACYCPEPLSERAQRALAQEDERAISSLVELEFVSALARKVRTHEMRRGMPIVSSPCFNHIWNKGFIRGWAWMPRTLLRRASGSRLCRSPPDSGRLACGAGRDERVPLNDR